MKFLLTLFLTFGLLLLTTTLAKAQKHSVTPSSSSSVFIQQIGIDNHVFSETSSEKGAQLFLQIGAKNKVQQYSKVANSHGIVLQKGNKNNVVMLQNDRGITMKTTVIQTGRNQNLVMLGANKLSQNMAITMKGANQKIVVRNFKRQR